MNILFTLGYVGTSFTGFQRQPAGTSVQNVLEDAFTGIFKEPILLTAAGRTDSGVHADEQVIIVDLAEALLAKIGLRNLVRMLNNRLPATIRIHHAEIPTPHFHPRFHARVRLYEYCILLPPHTRPPAEKLAFAYTPPFAVDDKRLAAILHAFVGRHDFTTFSSARDSSTNKERSLYRVDCRRRGKLLIIDLYANAYLRSMVRSILGNALALMQSGAPPESVQELIAARDPALAKDRVPAHALSLKRVFYTPIFPPIYPSHPTQEIWTETKPSSLPHSQ